VHRGLIAELSKSQPDMLKRMRGGIPGLYDKAYRWVAEMEEIADFHEANPAARDIYAAIARLYGFLAEAHAEKDTDPDNATRTLDRVPGADELN
jgi:putative dehydrogenase